MITKLEKEAIEHLQSTDIDIEQCKIISNQLEDKMKILNEAAINTQNTGNINVVTSSNASVESQNETARTRLKQ